MLKIVWPFCIVWDWESWVENSPDLHHFPAITWSLNLSQVWFKSTLLFNIILEIVNKWLNCLDLGVYCWYFVFWLLSNMHYQLFKESFSLKQLPHPLIGVLYHMAPSFTLHCFAHLVQLPLVISRYLKVSTCTNKHNLRYYFDWFDHDQAVNSALPHVDLNMQSGSGAVPFYCLT